MARRAGGLSGRRSSVNSGRGPGFSFSFGQVLLAGLLVSTAILAIRWQATLTSLGGFLVDSQPPQKADLILVLGGNFWGQRVLTGAELARLRYAPIALFSGPPYVGRPEGELAIEFLVQKGYPRELFQAFAHNGGSTIAEANALRGELARRHARRVLLVTSNYHSRRAAIVLTLLCPGVKFISIPAPDAHYHIDQWWNDDSSRQLFFSEWEKILGSVLIAYPTNLVSRWFGFAMAVNPDRAAISSRRTGATVLSESWSPTVAARSAPRRMADLTWRDLSPALDWAPMDRESAPRAGSDTRPPATSWPARRRAIPDSQPAHPPATPASSPGS
jgi:uncharacterized SAM-binding protein YcdF (DUF218 family)